MSKRSKRAGDSFSLSQRARAHARLWEGENLERVHRGRNHEGTLVPLLWVCLRDLRGLLFLALFIVKHAQVWGSSSFHFRSLFFPTLTFFFFFGMLTIVMFSSRAASGTPARAHAFNLGWVFFFFLCVFFSSSREKSATK